MDRWEPIQDSAATLTGLEAGTVYAVHLRVKYSGDRYTEWSFANANGTHTTNRPPTLTNEFVANGSYPWGAMRNNFGR